MKRTPAGDSVPGYKGRDRVPRKVTEVKRYAAFLRGVSPMNASMPRLRQAFESAGFHDVRTVLSSGNVVFTANAELEKKIAHKAERAMQTHLGASFMTIVRSIQCLREMIEANPFADWDLSSDAKWVVTFLRERPSVQAKLMLPLAFDGAQILALKGGVVFSAYVQSPRGAVFMRLIEKTFGREVTTRTWETVKKVVRAGEPLRAPSA